MAFLGIERFEWPCVSYDRTSNCRMTFLLFAPFILQIISSRKHVGTICPGPHDLIRHQAAIMMGKEVA